MESTSSLTVETAAVSMVKDAGMVVATCAVTIETAAVSMVKDAGIVVATSEEPLMSAPASVSTDTSEGLQQADAGSESEAASGDAQVEAGETARRQPRLQHAVSMDLQLPASFDEIPDGRHPFESPGEEARVRAEHLPAVSLESVASTIGSEGWLSAFLRRAKRARAISLSPLVERRAEPGVLKRKATFIMPVPGESGETSVTAVFRMHPREDMLVLLVQYCCHDAPFGANYQVHETGVFRPQATGGCDVEAFVEVSWVKDLPWGFGFLKGLVEQKLKADSLGSKMLDTMMNPAAEVDAELSRVRSTWSLDSAMLSVFDEAPGGFQPCQVPEGETPASVVPLSETLESIAGKVGSDSWLCSFLVEAKQAHSISLSPWAESDKDAEMLVRTATLIWSEEGSETKVSAVFGMKQTDVLVFTAQYACHDVPFGTKFLVCENVVFRPTEIEGTSAETFAGVKWIKDMPWGLSVLKGMIEHKYTAGALADKMVAAIGTA